MTCDEFPPGILRCMDQPGRRVASWLDSPLVRGGDTGSGSPLYKSSTRFEYTLAAFWHSGRLKLLSGFPFRHLQGSAAPWLSRASVTHLTASNRNSALTRRFGNHSIGGHPRLAKLRLTSVSVKPDLSQKPSALIQPFIQPIRHVQCIRVDTHRSASLTQLARIVQNSAFRTGMPL